MERYCSTGQSPERAVAPMEKKRNSGNVFEFSVKNISETDIFPHGTNSLMTSVIYPNNSTLSLHNVKTNRSSVYRTD
jgi:hypothetical protein